MQSTDSSQQPNNQLNKWRLKQTLKDLEKLQGSSTSMITLLIRPNTQVFDIQQMLTDEYSTATNIKSRVNRQSVESAITSIQQRLKLYPRIPPNGLALFCGTPDLMAKTAIEIKAT